MVSDHLHVWALLDNQPAQAVMRHHGLSVPLQTT
jgi:hypothetical protein